MSFCAICGRDHDPGPCPIPSVEPHSPDWEARLYMRLAWGALVTGLLFFTISPSMVTGTRIGQGIGVVALLVSAAMFWVSRKKRPQSDSKT